MPALSSSTYSSTSGFPSSMATSTTSRPAGTQWCSEWGQEGGDGGWVWEASGPAPAEPASPQPRLHLPLIPLRQALAGDTLRAPLLSRHHALAQHLQGEHLGGHPPGPGPPPAQPSGPCPPGYHPPPHPPFPAWAPVSAAPGSIPATCLQNCTYYWGFAAWMAYYINHPLYTPPSKWPGTLLPP